MRNVGIEVTGQATAVRASEGQAYGVNVYNTQVEIVAIQYASLQEGTQAAGQSALKKAGTQVASKVARIARELAAGEPSAQ